MLVKTMTEGRSLYTNQEAYQILLDVAMGLLYLHSQTPAIAHRDLKMVRARPACTCGVSNRHAQALSRLSYVQASLYNTVTPCTRRRTYCSQGDMVACSARLLTWACTR